MKNLLITIFYWANVAWMRPFVWWAAQKTIEGRENIPKKGPLIFVCNHLSEADPPLLAVAMPRRITWLVKAEWFKTPIASQMFKMSGMIPIRRHEADRQALRKAIEALENGEVLGIFPEGTRSKDKVLHEGEEGAAYVALKTSAQILPVAIWGTQDAKLPRDILKRTKGVHIRFGKPFMISSLGARIQREDVERGTETIMKAIASLLPEKYRGAYADASPHPDKASDIS
jgi:1-acyl-sn-glycerol-3-phosphate acyltransferase